MILTWTGARFDVRSSFQERLQAKAAGCRWDPAARTWWAPTIEVARKLAAYADEKAAAELRADAELRVGAVEASMAVTAEFPVPVPPGRELLPFQRAGAAYMAPRRRILLGDEMGLGKTVQGIVICNIWQPARVLLVVPASLKLNWKREWEMWTTRPATIQIARGGSLDLPEPPAGGAAVVIVNYDILSRHLAALAKWGADVLMIDECHAVKNPKAARSKTVYQLMESIPRILAISGTPLLNRPVELQPVGKRLGFPVCQSWLKFVERYCAGRKTRWGWDVSGATNLEELQRLLREQGMIRRLKADVLTELPAKRRQLIPFEPNGAQALVREERATYDAHQARIEELEAARDLAEATGSDEDFRAAAAELRKARKAQFEDLSRLRSQVAEAKIPLAIRYISDLLESEDKVVVMCHHLSVYAALLERFGDEAVGICGATQSEDRQAAVDAFQGQERVRVFVGTIKAAGVGITLTAARVAVFAELDWTWAWNVQAEDRIHRIGQTDSVLVHYLVLDGSVDQRVVELNMEKREIGELALDGGGAEDRTLDSLGSLAAEPEEPRRRTWPPSTPERRAQLTDWLRQLNEMCDGVLSRDGIGFSGATRRLGHALALAGVNTDGEAFAAERICQIHRGQLSGYKEKS